MSNLARSLDELPVRRLDTFPGIVLEVDATGAVTYANEQLRARMAASQSFTELLDENSVAKWERALQDPAPQRVELHLRNEADAEPHTLFVSTLVDGTRAVVELPRDPGLARAEEAANELNSELVNAQRELSRQKAELVRALSELREAHAREAQLTEELTQHNEEIMLQAEELERLMHSRDRFYSAMSHELRTPLTAVMGYLHLLLDGIAGPVPEQQHGFLERAHTAALHLKSLIDDVLDLARLESGALELELEQVALDAFTLEIVDTVMPLAREHGSVLMREIEDAPDFITTDARALRQILLNLLSNAAKFGESRPVRLRCSRREQDVLFEVIDHGAGIAHDDLDRIFEEFVQLTPGGKQGTGLGLAISRRLAGRLGGRLDVESVVGRGSTFRLLLPLAGPAAN